MASLAKRAHLNTHLLKNYCVLYSAVRNHWNKDFKPAPIPLTGEQRQLAAQKYGLHPSEYKVFPDDGTGNGDYPDIPAESGDSKDPNYPWDNPEHKRNFNEVMHVDSDMISEDRYDVNAKPRFSLRVQLAQFIGVMSIAFTLYYMGSKIKFFPGAIPKQYPGQGKVHYTFESKSSE